MIVPNAKIKDNEMNPSDNSGEEADDVEARQDVQKEKTGKPAAPFPLQGLLCAYRPATDAVASVIVNSKSEGASKFEIGKHIGLNAHSKAGARKIGQIVQVVTRLFPEYIDQFQKMTGKYRCIHYFLKDSAPGNLVEMLKRFQQLAGAKCPFSFGQIIKFPGTTLNTLRVSDVTFQRFLYILELLEARQVVVPSNQIMKHLQAKEEETGYLFKIDKKSIAKCLLALQKNRLCTVLSGTYEIDGVPYELELVARPDIQGFDDSRVQEAIKKTREEYLAHDRSFPSGVPTSRKVKKEKQEKEDGEKKPRKEFTSEAMVVLSTKMSLPVISKKDATTMRSGRRRKEAEQGDSRQAKRMKISPDDEEGGKVERRSGKRKPDETDQIVLERSIYVRSRFTPRERDMLILIRAVSGFLHSKRRLWIDASVIRLKVDIFRDIMHVYFEESRSKTVNSLLAASVRDLVRNNRREDLLYVVKTLESYRSDEWFSPDLVEEMKRLRNKIAGVNLHDQKEVNPFFMNAFETAYNLLYREDPSFPAIQATDDEFHEYLTTSGVFFPRYEDPVVNFPRRSRKALDVQSVQYSLAYNLVMSILLNDVFKSEASEGSSILLQSLVRDIDAGVMVSMLSDIQMDTLISKSRGVASIKPEIKEDELEDVVQEGDMVSFRPKQTICSRDYRSYFTHKFNAEILEAVARGLELLKNPKTDLISQTDDVGLFVLLSEYLSSDSMDLELMAPDGFDSIFASANDDFQQQGSGFTKQLRHLERAALQIQRMEISASKLVSSSGLSDVSHLTKRIPTHLLNAFEVDKCVDDVRQFIIDSGVVGVTKQEILTAINITQANLASILSQLEGSYAIFPCGVEAKRYVARESAKCWMVQNSECSFFPKPWLLPSGEVNFPVLRWMSESILVMVMNKPGVVLSELTKSYSFVLQPSLTTELLELLEQIGCLRIVTKTFKPINKSSPFQREPPKERVQFVLPASDGLVKFALFVAKNSSGQQS